MTIKHEKLICKVINLDGRPDRLKEFEKNWNNTLQYFRFPAIGKKDIESYSYSFLGDWIDPVLHRPHTAGEVGCFLSHYHLWKECADNGVPYLILEDDVYPDENFKHELNNIIDRALEWDILYMSYMDMNPDNCVTVSDGELNICRPGYPYWACAYIITPAGAEKLLNTDILFNMIPVDEYLPIMCGCFPPQEFKNTGVELMVKRLERFEKLNGIGLQNQVVFPFSRTEMGSDIEEFTSSTNEEEISGNLVLTATVTDRSKADMLEETCKKFGYTAYFMGIGRPWTGGDMESGPGGFQKVELLKEHLIDRELWDDNDILLVVDGYDVFLNDSPSEVLKRFYEIDADIVFAAEKECWPDVQLEKDYPESDTPYRFLNSGCFIGKASKIKELIQDIENYDSSEDDQLFYHMRFLQSKGIFSDKPEIQNINIVLDTENYIFQCASSDSLEYLTVADNKQILNTETRCYTCIIHANGPENIKNRVRDFYYNNFSTSAVNYFPQYFVNNPQIKALSSDILELDFLTPLGCEKLIEMAEKNGSWEQLPGDSYPAQEKRLDLIWPEMFDMLKEYLSEKIYPIMEDYWNPVKIPGLADAFVIKYSMDSQRHLDCHNDTSLVSLSVKLNDDYQGAELFFYRQNFSNSSVKKGKAIAWPGQVSHPHECKELEEGTKYSLTIWTARTIQEVK